MRVLSVLLVACGTILTLAACEKRKDSEVYAWPGLAYDKVVAYYFVKPAGSHNYSTIDESGLLEAKLAASKVQEKKLSGGDVRVFQKACFAFNPDYRWPRAACYDPHHVFVFYDKLGKAVAAFEVCFECYSYTWWPATVRPTEVDYIGLTKLCGALGLPMNPLGTTAKEQEESFEKTLKMFRDFADQSKRAGQPIEKK